MKINELENGARVEIKALILKKEQKLTKSNKPYFDCVLSDSTGTISTKFWDARTLTADIGQVIQVSGTVDEYNGNLQLIANFCTTLSEGYEAYLVHSPFSTKEMFAELVEILKTVENNWCKKLLLAFLQDTDFVKEFKVHSAAKSIHHDYVSGLLEHTLSVTKISAMLAKMYGVNYDLCVTSAFLHDIGKMKELTCFPELDYTLEGNAIGHVSMSALEVQKRALAIEGFPEDILTKIIHCILSHHGRLEFGSPKLPAMAEAMIVSCADLMDARIKVINDGLAKNVGFCSALGCAPIGGDFSE